MVKAAESNEPSEITLLERGSNWKYLDDGTDQGTAWKETNFDESGWKSGPAPLGYQDHGTFVKVATVIDYGVDSSNKHAKSNGSLGTYILLEWSFYCFKSQINK